MSMIEVHGGVCDALGILEPALLCYESIGIVDEASVLTREGHRLKRKCTGTMPCDNCNMIGSNCRYSVAGKLGRPRGSKTRRARKDPASSTKHKPVHATVPDIYDSTQIDDMLHMRANTFESTSSSYDDTYIRDFNSEPDPNILAAFEADMLSPLDPLGPFDDQATARLMDARQTVTSAPHLARPQYCGNAQELSTNPYYHECGPTSSGPSSPMSDLRRTFSFTTDSYMSCQCLQHLSALLSDLKHTENISRTSPVTFDSLLFRISETYTHWDALAACICWSRLDDSLHVLLLAALDIRRVVSLLQTLSRAMDSWPLIGTTLDHTVPKLYLGSFEVQGPEKIEVLGLIRKATVHKLDAVVTMMQGLLWQATPDAMNADKVCHISSLLWESAEQNK